MLWLDSAHSLFLLPALLPYWVLPTGGIKETASRAVAVCPSSSSCSRLQLFQRAQNLPHFTSSVVPEPLGLLPQRSASQHQEVPSSEFLDFANPNLFFSSHSSKWWSVLPVVIICLHQCSLLPLQPSSTYSVHYIYSVVIANVASLFLDGSWLTPLSVVHPCCPH